MFTSELEEQTHQVFLLEEATVTSTATFNRRQLFCSMKILQYIRIKGQEYQQTINTTCWDNYNNVFNDNAVFTTTADQGIYNEITNMLVASDIYIYIQKFHEFIGEKRKL